MHFPMWWLYRIRKCIFHISLVLKRHIPLCTIKKCNLPKATAFLMMLSYKLPTAGSSCSFNYPKDSSLRTCSWNMVVRSRLTWKFFIGGSTLWKTFVGQWWRTHLRNMRKVTSVAGWSYQNMITQPILSVSLDFLTMIGCGENSCQKSYSQLEFAIGLGSSEGVFFL